MRAKPIIICMRKQTRNLLCIVLCVAGKARSKGITSGGHRYSLGIEWLSGRSNVAH